MSAMVEVLVGDQLEAVAGVRRWSRPAIGYRLSGPWNEPGRELGKAGRQATHPLPRHGGEVRPAQPEVAPEPALQPAA
jgi:hypothetical protein